MSFASPSVEAFIGLGSNLDNPLDQLTRARAEIAALDRVAESGFSSIYVSEPVGPQDQPDYINAVMRVVTDLEPLALLRRLQGIENHHGRLREVRWGARTLDLDILFYAEKIIDEPDLIVPHPEFTRRAFVLYPLADLMGVDWLVPGHGPLSHLLLACPSVGLRKLN